MGVVVVTGLVLRFVTTSHLWLDEALSVNIAALPLGEIGDALRHDGHPPLYYFVLHGWIDVFGSGDVAVRALSGIFGIAVLPLAWVAARRLGGVPAAWATVVVLALNPFALRYATETRMYSLVMVLVLAGWLLVDDALRRPSGPRLAGIAAISGTLLLTHYWSLWLVAASVGLLVWRARRSRPPERRAAMRTAAAVAAGGVALLPWLPALLYQAEHTGTPWAGPARPTVVVYETLTDLGGGRFSEGHLTGTAVLGLAAVGLFGRTVDRRRVELDLHTVPEARRPALVIGGTLAVACVAMYVTDTTYASRYAAVFTPFLFVLAGVGLSRFPGRAARGAVAVALVALSAAGAYRNVAYDRTQAGDIAEAIGAGAAAGDLVVACPDQLGPALERLLPIDLDLVTYPRFGPADRVDWVDYEERNAAADPAAFVRDAVARAGPAATIWVVSSGSYRTLEGQCEAVVAGLGTSRAGAVVVAENADDFFEHASLHRFAP